MFVSECVFVWEGGVRDALFLSPLMVFLEFREFSQSPRRTKAESVLLPVNLLVLKGAIVEIPEG